MKVLVTGSAGLPGHEVVRMLEDRGTPCLGVDKPDLDLADTESVRRLIEDYAPDAVIHCAGYTDSDKAETLPERCAALNGLGTLTVARAAAHCGAKMLFLSSPHVFPCVGDQPYTTSDAYGPKNVFGMSKVQGEDATRSLLTRYFIVRADWIYGNGKKDFLKPLMKAAQEKKALRVASDQVSSPTYAKDLAKVICDLIATDKYGIWHARNEGYYSRADFASLVMKKAGINCRILPILTSELPGSPRRPLNCRMTGELPAGIGPMPIVEEALESCLRDMNR